ncbi:ABC transporter six-transmembrane domain-containing protein [Flavobacteriaceae bacterium S356]|uniref:ABC transporter six-transmembrane domain-containing protein n=1 Tax=Asprobacillus argus TaxID=3076534 RepID=A0ABU3LCK0_9FLAO|nr:ABC transporter six-transmembrane domain-containing protein [Flavobacteriaceae bacterium S356]
MNIRAILKQYRPRFVFTFLLLLLESGINILFPLFIGYAIDNAINGSYTGALYLGGLSISALVVGVIRRVFDSRFYAKVYQNIGLKADVKIQDKPSSVRAARLSMIGELVEFLENSLPELINTVIGFIGVIVIMATLNMAVFYSSVMVSLLIFLVYWLSSKKTIAFNKSSNDEFEKQVIIIATNDKKLLSHHLKEMMKWNIKLSDLEALNFSISWIALSIFLVASIVISIHSGILKYGLLLSLVMYVFQYMESVINLPFFYQSWLRLREIKTRIETI